MSDESTKVEVNTRLSVLCSICLDEISDDVDRSMAKLHCGHYFHLDCIGSAFNIKGAMQCPNCRKVEQGRWLYISGPTRSTPAITMNNWTLHENRHGLSYPETPFTMQWCPFSGLARVPLAFEALESLPPAYHNLHRHHNMLVEHRAASSVPNSYIAYLRPIPSASSYTNAAIEEPNFNYMPHHHLMGVHANSTDQAQVAPVFLGSSRGDFGAMTRSGLYIHPSVYGHGGPSQERLLSSHTIHQPTNPLGMPLTIIPNMPRFHGRMALPQPSIPANSVSNRNGAFFIIPSQDSSAISSQRDSNRTGNF